MPPLILRMGITWLFAMVVIAVALSAVIRYPEQMELRGTLMSNGFSSKGNDCEVGYICPVGLRQKERLKVGMPVSIAIGEEVMAVGKIAGIDSLYNGNTGLFNIQVQASAKRQDVPLFIQYKDRATVRVDVSCQTVLEKLLGRHAFKRACQEAKEHHH